MNVRTDHPSSYLDCLTGIRGFAAIWVVLYHLRPFFNAAWPDWTALNKLVAAGFLGVDLFSFLSGFIITYIYLGSLSKPTISSVRQYFWLRFARTYPLHLFILGLFLAIFVFKNGSSSPGLLTSDGPFWRQLFLVNSLGFDSKNVWNVPSWTLSAEWLCYLIFPFTALFLGRVRNSAVAMALAFATLLATSWALAQVGHSFDAHLKWGALRITGEFFSGCLLCRAHCVGLSRNIPFGWIGLYVLFGTLLAIGYSPHMSHINLTLIVSSFPILILALAQNKQPLKFLFANPVSIYLGEISYSIYLIHWIFIGNRGLLGLTSMRPEIAIIAVLTGTILIATLTYTFVEQPSRRWLRKHSFN